MALVEPFMLVVRFDLIPGHELEFDDLVMEMLQGIEVEEPETRVYITHHVAGTPTARLFYEVYTDRRAFEAHERFEHTRHFLDQRRQHLAKEPRVEFLTRPQGKGFQ